MSGAVLGIEGKVVAITGASSGIGEATSLLLAARGAKLALGARRPDRLAALTARIAADGGSAASVCVDVIPALDEADSRGSHLTRTLTR